MNASASSMLSTVFNTPTFLRQYGTPSGDSVRKALYIRESGHNAVAAGATNMHINGLVEIEGLNYLMCCHDGEPFIDLENQKECITPNRSGLGGRFGQGGSNSGFLGVVNYYKMETIWYSKNKDGKTNTVRLTMNSHEQAVIEDLSSKLNKAIEKELRSNDMNVAYLVRWEPSEKNKGKDTEGFGLINGTDFGIISQMCRMFEKKLNVQVIQNIYTPDRLAWVDEYDHDFCLLEHSWSVQDIQIEKDLIVDCEVIAKFYPNFHNPKHHRAWRIRGPQGKYGPGTSLAFQRKWDSAMMVFINHDKFANFASPKTARATQEPVTLYNEAKSELLTLGLPGAKKDGSPIKLKELDYDALAGALAEFDADGIIDSPRFKNNNEVTLRPGFDLEVRITPKDNTDVSHRFTVGQLSPFFVLEDPRTTRRDIIKPCIEAIEAKYGPDIDKLREKVEAFYPDIDAGLLPIDEKVASGNLTRIEMVLQDSGNRPKGISINSEDKVTSIEPQDNPILLKAYMRYKGDDLEGVKEWSHSVAASDNGGLYNIMIPDKNSIDGNGNWLTAIYNNKQYKVCKMKLESVEIPRLKALVSSVSEPAKVELDGNVLRSVTPFSREISMEVRLEDEQGNQADGVTIPNVCAVDLNETSGSYIMTVFSLEDFGSCGKKVKAQWNGSEAILDFVLNVEREKVQRSARTKRYYDRFEDPELIARYDAKHDHLFLNPEHVMIRELAHSSTSDKLAESTEWSDIWRMMKDVARKANATYKAYDEGMEPMMKPEPFFENSSLHQIWLTTILSEWLTNSHEVKLYRRHKGLI